ncbi:MAG: hypothetical protein JWQ95_6694 [Sphaerisporangium sp.]|jgi:hypothetical protein|nr:hypothetical protein [Sphaerisporangium sp.]
MSLTRESTACRVLERLETWPAVHVGDAACGTGTGVGVNDRQVLHLHADHEADLCLSRSVIERMGPTLMTAEQVILHPGRGWVGVRLETDGDIDLLVALFSVAVKAHLASETRPELIGCSASA